MEKILEVQKFSLKIKHKNLINDLSFKVKAGEILTIMGPSGSGKSTILLFIVGLLDQSLSYTGDVILNGRKLNFLPTEKRKVGLLFQDDLLFPHLTVLDNLIIGIPAKVSVRQKKQLATDALATCELSGYENYRVQNLSGGQKSRISLWRTLLSNPHTILLDEPFSKLDSQLKAKVKTYFKTHILKKEIPAVLVTHDPQDALWAGGKLIDLANYC